MGFSVAEELDFPAYGISIPNCYITIRAAYTHNKHRVPLSGEQESGYLLSARYYVYASQESTSPLQEETITLNLDTIVDNPIAALYSAIKTQYFLGKTITDIL